MPDYHLPFLGLLRFAPYFFLAHTRSFARDGRTVIAANPHLLRVEGLDNVPRQGPFILAMNHYNRRGLRPQICAFIISAKVAAVRPGEPELSWVFAEELERFIYAPLPVPRWLMRWMFRRAARVYGHVALPRAWRSPLARAAALRRVARKLRTAPVGMTPEGGGPGVLRAPPAGSGLLLLSLSRRGAPLLPVGVYEDDGGTLTIRFGPTFHLSPRPAGSNEAQDQLATEAVMTAIARLLPEKWQGEYRKAAAGESSSG